MMCTLPLDWVVDWWVVVAALKMVESVRSVVWMELVKELVAVNSMNLMVLVKFWMIVVVALVLMACAVEMEYEAYTIEKTEEETPPSSGLQQQPTSQQPSPAVSCTLVNTKEWLNPGKSMIISYMIVVVALVLMACAVEMEYEAYTIEKTEEDTVVMA
jgi:ABC-type transport system involved in multi-copper enzyme maturation permease subunit